MIFHMVRAQIATLLSSHYFTTSMRLNEGRARVEDFEKLAQQFAQAAAKPGENRRRTCNPFFAQWLNSTGVPEFTLEYWSPHAARIPDRRQGQATAGHLQMPVELRIDTEEIRS